MSCRAFFDENIDNSEFCKVLQELPLDTLVGWERETASELSPGVVKDHEVIVRYWLNPVHYDNSAGVLKVTAFSDSSSFGLSVNRLDYASIEEIHRMAKAYVVQRTNGTPPKPTELIGYSEFEAGEVRSVQVQGSTSSIRAFGVYDTALPDDKSHADICQIAKGSQAGRSARAQMREIANARLKRF